MTVSGSGRRTDTTRGAIHGARSATRRLAVPDVPFSLFATAAATLMVTVAACGSAGRSTKSDPTSASTRAVETLAPAAGSVRHRIHETGAVRVARTAYGRELVDRRGFALYLFTHDRSVHR